MASSASQTTGAELPVCLCVHFTSLPLLLFKQEGTFLPLCESNLSISYMDFITSQLLRNSVPSIVLSFYVNLFLHISVCAHKVLFCPISKIDK